MNTPPIKNHGDTSATTDTWPRISYGTAAQGPRDCTDWVPHDKARDLERALRTHLTTATKLLTRCRDSAGRVELGLYEEIQEFLHQHQ